jgi:organic hydroperoxide reductase OsmC/OhrA
MPTTKTMPLFIELTAEQSDTVRGGAPVAVVNSDGTVTIKYVDGASGFVTLDPSKPSSPTVPGSNPDPLLGLGLGATI